MLNTKYFLLCSYVHSPFTLPQRLQIPYYHCLLTFISQHPLPPSSLLLYHLFLIFFLRCAQKSAPGCLTHVCQATLMQGWVRWEDICAGKGTSHISGQLGNPTTFPHHLFFLASSDPFLMAKICLAVYKLCNISLGYLAAMWKCPIGETHTEYQQLAMSHM